MPEDIQIQSYSGSTSEEKLAIPSKWERKKLKAVTIQDETDSALKHKNQTVEEMFQHHHNLMKQIEGNHEPEKISLHETAPVFDSEELSGCNEKNDAFNHMLNQLYEHNERYQIIPLNALLASKNNMTAYYHKNLNDAMGTPFLKISFCLFC